MTITDDYTEADRWDWDQSNPDQHCIHGKFIGSSWGPDLLCQWCEDGVSLAEYRSIMRAEAERRDNEQRIARLFPLFVRTHYRRFGDQPTDSSREVKQFWDAAMRQTRRIRNGLEVAR